MRIRTGYSFRTAVGHLPEVVSRVKEISLDCLPVSDRMSTFAFEKMTKLAKDAGLRPIYGVELAVVTDLGEKRPSPDFWSFFATESVRPLHDLIYAATSNPGKEPSLLYQQAMEAPGLIRVCGERVDLEQVCSWGPSRTFYFGLSPSTPKGLYERARKLRIPMIATSDNVYTRATDLEFYRVAMGFRASTQSYPQHIMSDEEWRSAVSWFTSSGDQDTALLNRSKAMASCQATLRKAELLVPAKPRTLRQMCVAGAKKLGVDLKDDVYAKRLDRELAMIAEKRFEDYFYILADMIGWAKERMVVGPARGSSCGSLACYLLGITSIDPIPYGLVFERFIDVTRADLPDVDVDFSDQRRHLVFEYAEQKYGRDHVARLGTVGSFQPTSALNQVAVALRIPDWRIKQVTAGVIKRAMGDSRASQTIEDTLDHTDVGRGLMTEYPEARIVTRLEDHPTTAGQHAAGVVITKLPVAEHVAVDARTGAIMADKKDAEVLDLLKIDALGLTQLSIFERTLDLIGQKSVSGWLERIPLDDPAAFAVLNDGHFSGVFQFTGQSVQGITKQIEVDSIDDLIAIGALARPGPIGGGGTEQWVRRRTGREQVSYPHPAFEPYLRDTLGIVTYQEQVLAIGREIGDLSWEEVTKLRQAMSKSLGKEFFDKNGGDKWRARAIEKGIPEAVVNKMWEDLCTFGMWAFNKAHSVAYGIVSYWCCYLKAHHPVEFAAATLDAEDKVENQIAMLREMVDEGIEYVPFDARRSTDKWEPVKRGRKTILVGPLSSVRGIGPSFVREILEARRTKSDLRPALEKRLAAGKTDIDSLFPVRDAAARLIKKGDFVSVPVPIKRVVGGRGEVMIIGVANKIAPLNENEPVRVAKRGGRRVPPNLENALNLFVRDDTDEMFCKVHARDFPRIGQPIVDRGRPGRVIYALKGNVTDGDFRMMWVKNVKFVGEL